MSAFKAEVVKVDIVPHPNADRLDIAKVRGWQCVAQKETYKNGDLAVYLPIDSVLPPELVAKLGIEKNYHKRLRTIKLRGEISQGMLMPLSQIPGGDQLQEGADVTEKLGILKYEPPITVEMAGIVRSEHPKFQKYTDIENLKNYPDAFVDGDAVVATEKIHGSNGRAAMIDGQIHVGNHNRSLMESESNLYWRAARLLKLPEKLKEGDQVFFEVYGGGVQDLSYGCKNGEIRAAIFDWMADGKYLLWDEFIHTLEIRGVSEFKIPLIYYGAWTDDIAKLASGSSQLDKNQIKEGVVIKSSKEEHSEILHGRKIVKCINDDYLLRKNATERH